MVFFCALIFCVMMVSATTGRAASSLCSVTHIASLTLRNTGYTLTLSANINGKNLSLVLDTGAEGSLLTAHALAGLDLQPDNTRHAALIGVDGRRHNVPLIAVDDLSFHNSDKHLISLGRYFFPLGELPGIPMITPPILGLLGMDILGQYDLDIDLPHQRLALWQVALGSFMCHTPPYWNDKTHPVQSLTPQIHNRRFIIPFTLDGHQGTALIDTGARSHILSTGFAHKMGINDDELAHDPGGLSGSIASGQHYHERPYYWHHFHLLQIGTENDHNPTLTVAPLQTEVDMLLGADWLTTHRVWLSPTAKKIFIQATPSP